MFQTAAGITLLWETIEYPRMHSLHGDIGERDLLLKLADEFRLSGECVDIKVINCVQLQNKKFTRSYLYNWKKP